MDGPIWSCESKIPYSPHKAAYMIKTSKSGFKSRAYLL